MIDGFCCGPIQSSTRLMIRKKHKELCLIFVKRVHKRPPSVTPTNIFFHVIISVEVPLVCLRSSATTPIINYIRCQRHFKRLQFEAMLRIQWHNCTISTACCMGRGSYQSETAPSHPRPNLRIKHTEDVGLVGKGAGIKHENSNISQQIQNQASYHSKYKTSIKISGHVHNIPSMMYELLHNGL